MSKAVSTIGICALAGYVANTDNPGYAFLIVIIGLALVWNR